MNTTQYIISAVIFAFIFNKASRYDAIVLTLAYLIYEFFIVDTDAIYYYSLTAQLNLFTGLALHNKNKLAAICSYAIVLVNVLGFWLWYQYLPPTIYDNIALSLLVIQAITITPRGLLNGLRNYFKPTMAGSSVINSNEPCITINKKAC